MGGSRLNVLLYRDSFNTPWGFRLQGGTDLNQPLVVQRVFSNSPAEGELQRGDFILSINNKDTSALSHKQAQDLIINCGGQAELVINRPPLGSNVAPLSPPARQPRAPSLSDQVLSPGNSQFGLTKLHDKFEAALKDDETPCTHDYVKHRLDRLRAIAHSNAAQQGPRAPRDREEETYRDEPDRLASGPIPRACHRGQLGGGGFNMGSTYGDVASTMPRMSRQHSSSQPPNRNVGGAQGFTPTKISLNKIGGGGPTYGSDYNSANRHKGTVGWVPLCSVDVPERKPTASAVHSNLENMVLSPRTPEVPQGSPFQPMEEPEYQAPPQPAYQAPPQPAYQAPPQQQYQQPDPRQYTPTALLLDQQRAEEQRLEQELLRSTANRPLPTGMSGPLGGQNVYSQMGTDYRSDTQKKGVYRAPTSKPYKPKPAPPMQPPQHAPPQYEAPVQQDPPQWQRPPQVEDDSTPAWKNTLRGTGVKPWDRELQNQVMQEDPRSVQQYAPPPQQMMAAPAPMSPPQQMMMSPQMLSPAPAVAPGPVSPVLPMPGSEPIQKDPPKVVHLQYNSPMGLYSQANMEETLAGQTAAVMDQTTKPKNPDERDWSQSAVLQFIQSENSRGKPAPATAPKPAMQQAPQYDDMGATDF